MTEIPIPDGMVLSPQEWRVFAALHDWADKRAVARAINEPNGRQRYSPPHVIVSKLRKKISRFGFDIETRVLPNRGKGQKPVEYRIVTAEQKACAA